MKVVINLSNHLSSDIYLLKKNIEFTADNNDLQVEKYCAFPEHSLFHLETIVVMRLSILKNEDRF